MNIKHIMTGCVAAAALSLSTACTGDLDQYPHTETTSKQVYTTIDNYEAVLGKIYASMTASGQTTSGTDLSSNHGENYMRMFINLQEAPTDEMAYTWLTGDDMTNLSYIKWDATDTWVSDMYYRIYYNISLCNEFIRNCSDSQIASMGSANEEKMKRYKAEARFMRALFYYHALDFFRNIPFVTENDPVGSYTPPCYTPAQTFEYIESELKDCVNDLADRSSCPYGEASKGAAYTLLAKLYLNAETYTGTAKYNECAEACAQVIGMGYSLNSDYKQLFNADNDKRTNEIIFALPQDPDHLLTYGSTTYLICGAVSSTSTSQVSTDYGVASPWGNFRSRGDLVAKFEDGDRDHRYCFFTDGQEQYITDFTNQQQGYLFTKWTNLTDAGETASNTASYGAATDFPLFRLADVYLMYAEAVVRGATTGTRDKALDYVNQLRQRAYGDASGNIAMSQLTKNFILDERARELYMEGTRRTDLIRYDKFTTSSYVWEWKGGTKDGMAVDSKYNIYPIPSTDLTANPNLHNDNY